MNTYLIIMLSCLFLTSCGSEEDLLIPSFGKNESLLDKAKQLDEPVMTNSEGVYSVVTGGFSFGDSVVLKWNNGKPSIFCSANAAFMILDAGEYENQVIFEGYWRYAYGLETGRIRLVIKSGEGADELLRGEAPAAIIMQGVYGTNNGDLTRPITLRFARKIKQAMRPFFILGHRGGGRNSDLHPYSENSAEMIEFAERLGCIGVEIDVRLTKDGVPMLYHDELMNTRLVKADYLVGPFSDYTYGQLRRFATLIHDEKIPTLAEALETAIDKTKLSFIWLDIKTPDVIAAIAPILNEFQERAKKQQRQIEVVIGLPDDDIFNAYLALDSAVRPPSLCELSVDQSRIAGSKTWAPRWTAGTQFDLVRQMHSEGRKAFTWTLDVASFLADFFRDGEFDGFLSNYPTLVSYMYYMRK